METFIENEIIALEHEINGLWENIASSIEYKDNKVLFVNSEKLKRSLIQLSYIKYIKKQINRKGMGRNEHYTMYKTEFTIDKPTIDSQYLIAKCPYCSGTVIYNKGCENCKSEFKFKDKKL